MTTTEKKAQFIIKRAEGQSIRSICQALSIGKHTGAKWQAELSDQIRAARAETIEETLAKYRLTRAARLARYGDLLARINDEIAARDFSDVPTDKLIRAAVDLEDRLERLETCEPIPDAITEAEGVLAAADNIYRRILQGEVTAARARIELAAVDTLGKAVKEAENAW